ncbi:PE-PPE domain-containing protein [Mycobacterium sp. UM_Kg1]|uniref:PE-PPE domain-containing protein n=1 Tax=Mycobacterium sp. UM_Kg1 TaxID=1545691 RepID=UPI000695B9C8|nr:PE-PPE domain-containing protein [Mycobacterium sp. UM_Kg1]
MFEAVTARSSHRQPGVRAALAAAALVAGMTATPPLASAASAAGHADVLLSAVAGGPLADSGIALIMGPSMIPTPSPQFAETVNELFLQPNGFAGQLQVLTTPQEPYLLDSSLAEGAQILVEKVLGLIESGEVDADNPVTVFGYSQSAALATLAMQQLAEADVPSSAVHFVLIGNSANPNGGMLVGFENMPELAELMGQSQVTLGNPTPSDLYPTSIYTLEYDGYADFPRYAGNIFAFLNAVMGTFVQHVSYLGLTPEQIAGATLLESSPDSLISSYVIESEYLPLLWPLLFVPITGKPLYELMEPTMRILVNLGYGNIEHGWNDGPADQPTMVTVDPQIVDWNGLSSALAAAAQTGWNNFVDAIFDPSTYVVTDMVDNPALDLLLAAGDGVGLADGADPQAMLQGLTNMLWESLVGQYLDPAYWEAQG